jgi:hypothetical protein
VRSHFASASIAAGALIVLAGCTAGSSSPQSQPTVQQTITKTAAPKPTKTVVRSFQLLRVGASETLQSKSGAAMFIQASGPSVSTNRLSKTYGYVPSHGYYVTFKIKIKDVGSTPIVIQRLDFWLKTPGLGKITTNDGTAPVSGSPRQLDTTELTPGKTIVSTVSNNLTFDVSHPSGTLYYGPGGKKPTVAWRFASRSAQ